MRTADEIAGLFMAGDAARPDLADLILEYGAAMALAAAAAEREACAKVAVDAEAWARSFGGEDAAAEIAKRIRERGE